MPCVVSKPTNSCHCLQCFQSKCIPWMTRWDLWCACVTCVRGDWRFRLLRMFDTSRPPHLFIGRASALPKNKQKNIFSVLNIYQVCVVFLRILCNIHTYYVSNCCIHTYSVHNIGRMRFQIIRSREYSSPFKHTHYVWTTADSRFECVLCHKSGGGLQSSWAH